MTSHPVLGPENKDGTEDLVASIEGSDSAEILRYKKEFRYSVTWCCGGATFRVFVPSLHISHELPVRSSRHTVFSRLRDCPITDHTSVLIEIGKGEVVCRWMGEILQTILVSQSVGSNRRCGAVPTSACASVHYCIIGCLFAESPSSHYKQQRKHPHFRRRQNIEKKGLPNDIKLKSYFRRDDQMEHSAIIYAHGLLAQPWYRCPVVSCSLHDPRAKCLTL